MGINLIWASDWNGLIGKDNSLPWYLPSDLKYFKKTTTNKIVVMGRKTYESLGKALPNRVNIVISRNKSFYCDDAIVFSSVSKVLNCIPKDMEVFVIGGKEIFEQFLPFADRLYVTKIDSEFNGDTYFQPNLENFQLVSHENGLYNEVNLYKHRFFVYKRIESESM